MRMRVLVVIAIFSVVLAINIAHVYISENTLGWGGKVEDTVYGEGVLNRYGHFLFMRKHTPGVTVYVPADGSISKLASNFSQRFYSIVGRDAAIWRANYNPETFLRDIYPEEPKKDILYSRHNTSALARQDLLRTSMIVGADKDIRELVFLQRSFYDVFVDTRLLTADQLGELRR